MFDIIKLADSMNLWDPHRFKLLVSLQGGSVSKSILYVIRKKLKDNYGIFDTNDLDLQELYDLLKKIKLKEDLLSL